MKLKFAKTVSYDEITHINTKMLHMLKQKNINDFLC